MAYTATSGIVIQDLNTVTSTALTQVGTMVMASDGTELMYVTATKTVNQYDAVIIINSSSAAGASIGVVPCSTLVCAQSPRVAVAQVAMAINTYGWVVTRSNNMRVNVAVSCEPGVPLYATATAGILDDAIISAAYIAGLVAMSSAASASAVPAVGGPMIAETISL